ncbi:uncharacterized protein LOC119112255 [Pollicipes pollicipes]|uniref:uncharacterized protein LOC119112255 n=1 Tax=Pollicipes pollicipes TaxID=41117 RepID=UPI001884BACF|nr:uncharacterized protein LOC119112255 [Pollicipes pollicipes]
MADWRRLLYGAALLTGLLGQLLLIASLRDRHVLPQRWMQFDRSAGRDAPAHHTVATGLDDSVPRLIIIVSSSPRSGSSLLGEMLSTSINTAYFFEPFYYHLKQNISMASLSGAEVRATVTQLLNCHLEESPVLREAKFRRFVWKSRPPVGQVPPSTGVLARRCRTADTRVVKLVRPPLSALLPLLQDDQLGGRLRLVHLVRDPRGTVNSQLHASGVWSGVHRDPTAPCRRLRADLAAARPLRDPRYARVRYEQLALQPRDTATDLLRQLRLPWPTSLDSYLRRHMNASAAAAGRLQDPPARLKARMTTDQVRQWRQHARSRTRSKYFSTFRAPDFDPSHWRKELRPDVLQQIESECADVIAELTEDADETLKKGESTLTEQ